MKNNKLICIVLALLVCLTIAVSASATTEDDNGLIIELESTLDSSKGPATTVKPGETFTVTVDLKNNPGVMFYVGYVSYNAENLELKDIEAVDGVAVNKSPDEEGKLAIVIGNVGALMGGQYDVVTINGKIAVLTFEVKETAEDITSGNEITLENKKSNVVDANGKIGQIEIAEVESIDPTVVTEGHVCDAEDLVTWGAFEATCTEKGYEGDLVCPVCNKVHVEGKEIAAKGHELDEENYEIKLAPTCTTAGVKVLYCKNCDYTEEQEIAVDAHEPVFVTVPGYDATCEKDGLSEGVQCETCKCWKEVQEVIPAKGHDFQHMYDIDKATCGANGTEYVKCSDCGYETVREVAKKDHEAIDVAKKDATCVEAGYEAGKVCSMCGMTMEGLTEIPATGVHSYGDWYITEAPSCGDYGTKVRTCSVCGETETDDKVPATGAHVYGEWEVTIEATTDSEGVKVRTCLYCDATETRSIDVLPKDYTVVIVISIVVVVLAGAGVAAYFVLKNKKK